MNIALWITQILLAAMFGMGGVMKATAPFEYLHANVAWTTAVPDPLVRFIGTAELLGAIGLILPALTRIQPRLTPLAALGLLVIMILAALFHLMRGEYAYILINMAYGAVALFIAWGRTFKAPIRPRGADNAKVSSHDPAAD